MESCRPAISPWYGVIPPPPPCRCQCCPCCPCKRGPIYYWPTVPACPPGYVQPNIKTIIVTAGSSNTH